MNITEFLEARVAEDEDIARAALTDQRSVPAGATIWHQSTLPHVNRHDPARVLAECAAKRAIIAMYEQGDETKGWDPEAYIASTVFDAMRALAAVYKDHPDYQQEWAA